MPDIKIHIELHPDGFLRYSINPSDAVEIEELHRYIDALEMVKARMNRWAQEIEKEDTKKQNQFSDN